MTNKLGRPPIDQNEKTVNLSVSVTEAQARFLKKHGFGNASLGIRRLVDEKRMENPTPGGPGFKNVKGEANRGQD